MTTDEGDEGMEHLALYARSSHGREAVDAQLDSLRAALPQGRCMALEFTDSTDAGMPWADRPGLRGALGLLASGEARVLLVCTADRLARDRKQLAELERFAEQGGFMISSLNGQQGGSSRAAGRASLMSLK